MKFLVLLVFYFGVKANEVLRPTNKCGVGYDNEDIVTDENNIFRPCREDDYECMREFMAKNSDCKPAYGPVQDPLYLAQNTIYFAFANLTFTFTNYTTTGLNNASIVSFYYNMITENLVIAVEMPVLAINIPKMIIVYRRPGQESIVKSDVAYVTFESLIFTATIPKIGKFRFNKADIQHGYLGEAFPDFYVGPAAYTSKDPIVKAEYAEFLSNVPLAVRNTFLFESQLYASLYIQESICDFGVDIYSV